LCEAPKPSAKVFELMRPANALQALKNRTGTGFCAQHRFFSFPAEAREVS
ncbi:MAG: hypothetical protein ACI9KE_002010, partial [Polyangiales bacterium]